MILDTQIKLSRSYFTRKYSRELSSWLRYFDLSEAPILAISRKGPRLFELLHYESAIGEDVLNRVTTEYAIPFLKNITSMAIVDDSVLYGSTLKDTVEITKSKLLLGEAKLDILPFRVSIDAHSSVKKIINKEYPIPIQYSESPVHINFLIQSFLRLGKPYDLEFPIIYLKGDFSDTFLLREKLKAVCKNLEDADLIINKSATYPDRYTILVKGTNSRTRGAGAEFSKFRIFIRDDFKQLAITPISPCILSVEDIESFEKWLDPEFSNLWTSVINELNKEKLDEHDFRTLIVWANYLKSLSFLTKRLGKFERYFDINNLSFKLFDIQLLLGYSLAPKILKILSNTLKYKRKFVQFEQNFENYSKISEYKIQDNSGISFSECFQFNIEGLKQTNSESEILNSFFHCQHTTLELASRTSENFGSIKRLKFGFTLNYLIEQVGRIKPNPSLVNIHGAFDKLIDAGAIVPKYLNLSTDPAMLIWGRVFRIGEGGLPTSQKLLALLTLFESLKSCYNANSLPSVVFEKFSVISLTNCFEFDELNESGINELDIKKKFGLYGARSYVTKDSDDSGDYYLDWAKSLRIIKQNDKEEYEVDSSIASSYNIKEFAISRTARDKIEDLAKFCYIIANDLGTDPLVLLTTLASKRELWLALSAELGLWLNHPAYGIYSCLHKLFEIKNSNLKSNGQLLSECNLLLENCANFTAQVVKKIDLYSNQYEATIETIDKKIIDQNDINTNRIWRNIKEYLDKKKFENTGENSKQIIATLRIAHSVTSLCRTLLNKAGYKQKEGAQQRQISEHLKIILGAIEESKKDAWAVYHKFTNDQIQKRIRELLIDFNESKSFYDSFDEIGKILRSISDTVYGLHNIFGVVSIPKQIEKILQPPIYIMMWDIRKSTQEEDRIFLERNVILPINERIGKLLSPGKTDDFVLTTDDGNCFLSSNFSDIIMAFSIITEVSKQYDRKFRIGCDVNYEGELHVYAKSSTNKNFIAGRAYEYASRTMNLFKEVDENSKRWRGEAIQEPDTSYLIIGEFARRIANENGQWHFTDFNIEDLKGQYMPRVKEGTCIPYEISVVTPK